jgi:predicted outer membrane repeat protein
VAPQRDNPFDPSSELFSTDLFNIQTQNLSEHILISWEYTSEKPALDSYLLYRINSSETETLIYTGIETAFEDSDVEWGSTYSYYVTGKKNDKESAHPELDEIPEVVRGIYVGINSEYTKITDALNVLKDGDVIQVMSGIYVENIDFAGKNIKVICSDPGSCEIQGNNSDPVVSFAGREDTTAVMDGFKIKNNDSNEDGGAMMINEGSSPLIKNCIFEENSTTGDGGAIFCDRDAAPFIENCTFIDNQAEGDGGAIYCEKDSKPTITNCIFEDNKSDGNGGAIAIERKASPQVEQSTFRLNEAYQNGGAIHIRDSRDINFIQSIFEYNIGDLGGGLYIEDCDFSPKPIKFTNCIFWQNSAYKGGGIYSQESEIKIDYSTLTRNSAANGEGGALFFKMHNNIAITNSILWQNNADDFPEIAAESGTNIIDANHSDIEGDEIRDGLGNINVDPKFEDESEGDFQLENDSDCIGTDSNSSQMGAWGNGVTKLGATEE